MASRSKLEYQTRRWRHAGVLALMLCALLVLAGCQSLSGHPRPDLYQQLGERPGISRLSTQLILNIARDRRISGYFADTDIDRFHRVFTDYICMKSGGPCRYTGDNMIDAHRGLGVNDTAFNALVEDLITAMETEKLPTSTQNALLARLVPLKPEIVGKHPLPPPEVMQLILGHDPLYRYIAPELD